MKDETFQKIMVIFLSIVGILFLLAAVVLSYKSNAKEDILEERLACIQEVAEKQAYDDGDTTDMWWAIVEIARGE